ncbi:hypothetical protein CcaverHIS641_0203020 [Cutaneotrichosporon cavernicola]|nr:hypothetical protein CcaverHIS641_0203020 [Cutaneotrichosporon cavernicola]
MPLHNPLWEIAEPYLVATTRYTVADPTYGRYLLPHHAPTQQLMATPGVRHTFRRVFLRPFRDCKTWHEAYNTTEIVHSDEVKLEEAEVAEGVKHGGRWLFYSVWEMDEPEAGWECGGKGRGRDLVLVHGLSDYGLRYSPHVLHFLKEGFRVIMPDLPSYGRSTGVNSYLPSLDLLPAALHTVLTDVVMWDLKQDRKQQQVFLCGASMGAWTVLFYVYRYHPSDSVETAAEASTSDHPEPPRPQIAGVFALCPMVEASPESRPSAIIEYLAKSIKFFAGSLPLAPAVRGNVSDDPRVEEDFFADPLCYHGLLRVGTGLSLLDGMTELNQNAERINIPIRLIHGSSDRATSHAATERLFQRLPHDDKQFELYDGYEHIMLKVGIDDADDEKRQRVLRDWTHWLLERCRSRFVSTHHLQS